MFKFQSGRKTDNIFIFLVLFILLFSLFVLRSIAPTLFPLYLFYLAASLIIFFIFSQITFDVFLLFSKHFYIVSLVFLLLTVFIGQMTRGVVRWINLGPLTIQPSELVRPFLLIFFADFLSKKELTPKRFWQSIVLLILPVLLILIQPSLGVAILTVVGYLGILLATGFNKKYLLFGFVGILILIPLLWKISAPYQRQRILTFINPADDPLGSGYNSMQAMIAVGSGKILGRGLGKGVQTQLSFLPERHTDFIFASIAEELGFIGAFLTVIGIFLVLFKIAGFLDKAVSAPGRAYLSGLFVVLLVQSLVHMGMNMGLLPVTGVPLPLISAGGSSLLGTMMSLGIALGATKDSVG